MQRGKRRILFHWFHANAKSCLVFQSRTSGGRSPPDPRRFWKVSHHAMPTVRREEYRESQKRASTRSIDRSRYETRRQGRVRVSEMYKDGQTEGQYADAFAHS